MRHHRAGRTLLAITAASLLANAGACSSDAERTDDDGGVTVVPRPDVEVAGFCEPIAPPPITFVPPPAYQAKCTDAELERVLNDCVFENATEQKCEETFNGLRACFDCMFGTFQSNPAHPLVLYAEESGPRPSSATCMSNISGDTDPNGCAVAFGQVETCAFTACTASCLGATDEQRQACYEAAIGSVCTAGLERFDSPECERAYTSKAYGPCITGEDPNASDGTLLTNLEYFMLVSKLACGTAPVVPDAGAPDAPDADSSDADADAP
ncbi:MAG: hypothetical protein KIT84_39540 [Labilithrix sp.]|nr:hypothetical protein [Labilithrix sp.]MCW5817157.1 hypothetical protein [Labilithrix sp.]